MNGFDPIKKMAEIRNKNVNKNKRCIPDNMKICPFQSTPDEEMPCSQKCALYRGSKQAGYNCPLIELTTISWVLKGSPQKNSYADGQGRYPKKY